MEEKRTKAGTCDVNFSSLTHTRASCVCVCVNTMCVVKSPCACNALDLLSRIDVSSYSSCLVVGGTAVTMTLSDYCCRYCKVN